MTDFFHVPWTVKDLWVPMWVGKFGWYDYQFPNPINRAALVVYFAVAIAAVAALVPLLRRESTSAAPDARVRSLWPRAGLRDRPRCVPAARSAGPRSSSRRATCCR